MRLLFWKKCHTNIINDSEDVVVYFSLPVTLDYLLLTGVSPYCGLLSTLLFLSFFPPSLSPVPSSCPCFSLPHLHKPLPQTHSHRSITPPGLTLGLSLFHLPVVQSNACSSCPCSPPQHTDQSWVSWSSMTAFKPVPAPAVQDMKYSPCACTCLCLLDRHLCVCSLKAVTYGNTGVHVYRERSWLKVELGMMISGCSANPGRPIKTFLTVHIADKKSGPTVVNISLFSIDIQKSFPNTQHYNV